MLQKYVKQFINIHTITSLDFAIFVEPMAFQIVYE